MTFDSGGRPRTSIVIPCYNEVERLRPEAFLDFAGAHPEISFLFVNDGSTDATARVLRELAAKMPGRLEVLELPKNAGKGEAVRQGLLRAFANDLQYVGYWDADLATPLAAILSFVALLDERPGLVMVMGARVQLLGRRIVRRWTRHYLGRVFATAASMTLRLPCYDTQCGAKLFRTTDVVRGVFNKPFISRWIFDVEIIARLVVDGAVDGRAGIYEFPLVQWEDAPGSKIGLSAWWVALKDLWWIRSEYYFRD